MSQILITILAEIERMELKTIENRLQSGFHNFRANNGKVGHMAGFRKSEEEMKDSYSEEIKMLKKGYSYEHINQINKTNKNTLTKLRKLFIN